MQSRHENQNRGSAGRYRTLTSYVTVPPDVAGCLRVTLEIAPLADITHTARVPN